MKSLGFLTKSIILSIVFCWHLTKLSGQTFINQKQGEWWGDINEIEIFNDKAVFTMGDGKVISRPIERVKNSRKPLLPKGTKLVQSNPASNLLGARKVGDSDDKYLPALKAELKFGNWYWDFTIYMRKRNPYYDKDGKYKEFPLLVSRDKANGKGSSDPYGEPMIFEKKINTVSKGPGSAKEKHAAKKAIRKNRRSSRKKN